MSYMQLNVISLSHFVGWNQPCCIQADFDFTCDGIDTH